MSPKNMMAVSVRPVVLSILSQGDTYGYQIIKRVSGLSGGAMEWAAGSLYPVLHKMRTEGLIEAYWVQEEGARKRKYYCITTKGVQALAKEKQQWLTMHHVLTQLWDVEPRLT